MNLQPRRHGLARPGLPEERTACAGVRLVSANSVGSIVTLQPERHSKGWRGAIYIAISLPELTKAFRRSLLGDVIAPAAERELRRRFHPRTDADPSPSGPETRPDRQASGLVGRYRPHLETD